jgi:hypothetical protein
MPCLYNIVIWFIMIVVRSYVIHICYSNTVEAEVWLEIRLGGELGRESNGKRHLLTALI